MSTIAILTPGPVGGGEEARWRGVLARHAETLRPAGITVESRPWTDAGDLTGFDLVLPLLAWGYHRDGAAWRASVDRWQASGVRLQNPPEVLRWNADKTYLGRLADHGAPVVPTHFVDTLTLADMEEAAEAFGTDRLIAKPQASASAWRTIRWSPGMPIDDGPDGPAMIQPFLPTIEQGEISLHYFGGAFSHAIRKRPQPGDFRVQPEYDGIITAHAPEPDEFAAAEAVLAAVEDPLLYARIDLLRDETGTPLLMEAELVEPDLYVEHDPRRGAAFADAVRTATEA